MPPTTMMCRREACETIEQSCGYQSVSRPPARAGQPDLVIATACGFPSIWGRRKEAVVAANAHAPAAVRLNRAGPIEWPVDRHRPGGLARRVRRRLMCPA